MLKRMKWLCSGILLLSMIMICVPASAGTVWQQTNGLYGGDIRALAIDPTAPQTVYAGTFYGGGVFKSVNGGSSWNAVNTGLTNINVSSLAIDPTTPQTIYAG